MAENPESKVSKSSADSSSKKVVYEYLPPPTLEMRTSLDMMNTESAKEKFTRKFTEQPLVPLGCGFTAVALTYGLYQMKTGNARMSQRMMRMRILAQGFTVAACLAGVFYTAKSQRKPSTK